jgi:hypothetical protein
MRITPSWLVAATLLSSLTSTAGAEPILHVGPGQRPDATVGTMEITARPEQVYQVLTTYARWPELWRDVSDVGPPRGTRERARFSFTWLPLGQRWTVESDNLPNRLVRLWRADPGRGPRGRWVIALAPSDGGRRTLVTFTFHLSSPQVMFLDPDDDWSRRLREQKVRGDLLALARHFDPGSPRWHPPRDQRKRRHASAGR